jgi:hypothetical protein
MLGPLIEGLAYRDGCQGLSRRVPAVGVYASCCSVLHLTSQHVGFADAIHRWPDTFIAASQKGHVTPQLLGYLSPSFRELDLGLAIVVTQHTTACAVCKSLT